MSRNKTDVLNLDIAGLLALKTYERPDAGRAEKNIQSILREVRALEKRPSVQTMNQKLGIFAQPRYGIAALFVIFLGLHLIDRPMPQMSMGSTSLDDTSSGIHAMAAFDTNLTKAASVPGIEPAYNPLAGESAPFTPRDK